MPTPHRRAHLKTRARYDFEDSRAETDMEEIRACMMLGETQLDTILVQVVCSMPTGAAAPLCRFSTNGCRCIACACARAAQTEHLGTALKYHYT